VNRILAAGAYAPRFRVSAEEVADAWGRFAASGIESTAVPYADEDALTMAVAAARRALDAGGVAPDRLDVLAWATTTPPLAEEDLTARLGAMLGAPDDATRHQFLGSTRAGTRALVAALEAVPDLGLVVAADCPRGEPHDERDHAAGAGAAAFLVGDPAVAGGADGAGDGATVVDRAEFATPYPGTRFRRPGSERVEGLGITEYDRDAFRETTGGAVDGLDTDPDVDAAAVQAPDGAMPYRAAGALGVDGEAIAAHETVSELGDTGTASVPLSLAAALASGDDTLAVGYGSGAGADALVVEVDGDLPARIDVAGEEAVSYVRSLRLRGEVTADEPEGGGAYVSVPSWRRSLPQRYRLVAGRCPDCGALAFPPGGACDDCGRLGEDEEVALPGTGTVEAATTIGQGGAPPEFAAQQSRGGDFGVAVVAFDGPDRSEGGSGTGAGSDRSVSAPAQVTDGHDVDVGDRVEAVLRRVYAQEGIPRYGFKIRPQGGL
jgi:hydroxymethylglutaryl-CoA synthase